jgi:hypothetical protein
VVRNVLLFCIATALLATSAAASSIVTNGDFSAGGGSFSGWTTTACTGTCTGTTWSVTDVAYPATTGAPTTYAATNSCTGAGCLSTTTGETISQSLTTVVGQTYYLAFWYDPAGHTGGPGEGTDALDVYWNGVEVDALLNETGSTWQEYIVTGLTVSSTSTTLKFIGEADSNTLALTEISAATGAPPDPPAPEPASLTLIGGALLGFGAITAALRRRRKV